MKIKPKWIVFDVGGVLIDWKKSVPHVGGILGISENELMGKIIENSGDLDTGKMQLDGFWKKLLNKQGLKLKTRKITQEWLDSQPLIVSSWKLVNSLKKNNYKLSICTNAWMGLIEEQMNRIADLKLFDEIIDSSVEKLRKPDREMYLAVEKRLGASGNEIFFIDDFEENIEGAKYLGWQTYKFDFDAREADLMVKELEEILL